MPPMRAFHPRGIERATSNASVPRGWKICNEVTAAEIIFEFRLDRVCENAKIKQMRSNTGGEGAYRSKTFRCKNDASPRPLNARTHMRKPWIRQGSSLGDHRESSEIPIDGFVRAQIVHHAQPAGGTSAPKIHTLWGLRKRVI